MVTAEDPSRDKDTLGGDASLSTVFSQTRELGLLDNISLLQRKVTELTDKVIVLQEEIEERDARRGVLSVTPDGTILSVNDFMLNISGYSEEELVGKNISVMSSGTNSQEFWNQFRIVIQSGKTWQGDICNRAKDGSLMHFGMLVISQVDENGKVVFKVIKDDLTEFHLLNERYLTLREDPNKFDTLTGLPTREKCGADYSIELPRSIAIFHINGMNHINNSNGRDIGNLIIQQIGTMLSLYAKENQKYGVRIYKLEGPNFAIIYEKNINESAIRDEYIRLQNRAMRDKNQDIPLFFSLGIVLDESNIGTLLDNGLLALQIAKKNRECVIFDDTMNAKGVSKGLLHMQTLMEAAFENDLFEIHFQPIVKNPPRGKIRRTIAFVQKWSTPLKAEAMRYEALVRMINVVNPDVLVSPGEFLPIVDMAGRNQELTSIVIKKVCEARLLHPGHYSINLTEDDLKTDGRAMAIHKQICGYGIAPSDIGFEILEGIQDLTPKILENIQILRDLGFEIAIDDVGTGFSNLSRVSKFRAHISKIDKSLIRGINTNHENRLIVHVLIKLAHGLRMGVTVEGVETKEEFDVVVALGADYSQGYYFGKPIPFPKVINLPKK